ncbi:hypothetical protein Tco_0381191, partial [Tanacetum coccineum]
GITHRSNIDYAERIWEEFVQSIQTFLTDRKNLATASREKKKTAHLLIPNVRFTKLIIHHLKNKHNIHPRPHYSYKENILNTLKYVGKDGREIFEYQRYLNEEHDKADDKSPEPASSQPPKPIPTPNESFKKDQGKKHKMVMESTDASSLAKRSKAGKVTKKRMPKSSLQLVDEVVDEGGPARPVVIREHDSGRIQSLPEVQGKGKEKVAEEQAAHDLLTLQTPKPKNPADQLIFQRHTLIPTEPSKHTDSPSLDAKLALTDNETELEEEVTVIEVVDQDEGQDGPNPGEQDEGQAGSNPGDAVESQPQPSHVFHVGPNLEHMDLETTDASTQQKPEQMDKEFTTTAYPNVQENLKLLTKDQFFVEKPQEEELGKTNAEAEVQSMVSVLIHQDTSSVPLMTTPVSKAVDEIVTDAVDWAMQAPLRARFRDLSTVDMKDILQQRMFEDNTYKTHEVHNDLYEAL